MSGRALLAIGCDAYEHINPLRGAVADAVCIYDALIRPEIGDYDLARSRLLESPTLQGAREALTDTLFGGEQLDVLTVVFAGHGGVSGGSFYMAMRDSRLNALSATALSLADLLRMIAEAAPKQTYLFIDACQAGGLISDLNVILKSEVMGKFGTPGITLLATAASDESALEMGGHGVGTTALLDCIHGRTFLQDSNPALDLVEVGRTVSERVAAAGQQTPVVWGLNLYGPSSFCKNPHMSTGDGPLRNVLVGWPDANAAAAIRAGLPRLWEPFVSIATNWDPRSLLDRLAPLLDELRGDPATLLDFARRMTEACAGQARESVDLFREVEVRATCAIALLPFTDRPEVVSHLAAACAEIGLMAERAIAAVTAGVANYRYAVVTGGLSDLFQLPIRLSRLLGWAGYAAHARLLTGAAPAPATTQLSDMFGWIFETYSLSLVAMSDAQSPYILSAATAAHSLGLHDDGERLLGHMFSSAVDCGGRVARPMLNDEKILGYLLARSNGSEPLIKMVAQPTELMTTLLRASRLFGLADHFDASLETLDHLQINAYLPQDYARFGGEHIASGLNAVFQIGHDVWSVADIESAWPETASPTGPEVALTALLACLVFPDRSPWFLLSV